MNKVHCADCLNEMAYITDKRTRHWCGAKKKWIPQRHYDEGMKKCGEFILAKLLKIFE